MANQRLTDRQELISPASADLLHIVDVSDTTGSSLGTSKKITRENYLAGIASDKYYKESFGGLTGLTVNHNLGKYPAVKVFGTDGKEVEVSVTHMDENTCLCEWYGELNGSVICN